MKFFGKKIMYRKNSTKSNYFMAISDINIHTKKLSNDRILAYWISVELKKGRWGSCIANLELIPGHTTACRARRRRAGAAGGRGGQDRDRNIPVQILKIDNTMTLSLFLVSVNSELLSLTWNMGFFVWLVLLQKASSPPQLHCVATILKLLPQSQKIVTSFTNFAIFRNISNFSKLSTSSKIFLICLVLILD